MLVSILRILTMARGQTKKNETMEFLEGLMGGPLTFGEMVRSIRETDELTQEDVASKVGVSKQHVSDVENGRRKVSIARAVRWAHALGYPPRFFVRMVAQEEIDAAGVDLKVVSTDAA
jgi:DNA-binding XRE family transcriptional regulator